ATSGSTAGIDPNTDDARFSNEQAKTGTMSGKLVWTWVNASGGFVRIQPAAGLSNNAPAVNHSSEPFIGFAIYASATNDKLAFYMGEGSAGNGASPYKRFTADYTLNFTGWKVVERNILTDPVVAWVVGSGTTLSPTCSFSGFFWYQGAPASTTVTYYIDDISFTDTSRGPDLQPDAGVAEWSVY
ncbi:MAG: hypothetical protein N2Z21_06530, partial [Candidatus Sumerlaeaceae bacterium]|nr:hypothetical protein [Candidatus Sumerlaeaceae bacterium]